ncbi:MAG TPA: alcohol dehydrogenase catalytic domain-containing protein [Acidimicrobiales bacterium]|nr:alcohol dehydrogenase catalytic domain-containing protein [Acidimicrobiales bacterium]
MRAFRLTAPGETALVDVDEPSPGPGQVGLRIGSASFCHSDLELLHLPDNVPGIPVPVTLGHEMAGWIDALGDGVAGWEVGQPVAVHIIQGCGRCAACEVGRDNLCEQGVIRTPGVHYDGGVAERMVVDARQLVPLDGVDAAVAAPLTDAGLTAHHAVEWARPWLGPTASVLVIGVGGLGHLGLQIVSATSAARVLAADIDAAKVDLATRLGAEAAFVAGPDTAEAVLDANGGHQIDVVLDFAGVQASVDLGVDVIRRGGTLVVTGMGGGQVPLVHGFGGPTRRVPPETPVVASFAGARADLHGALGLARRGLLRVEATAFALADAPKALAAFAAGDVVGRAVINP